MTILFAFVCDEMLNLLMERKRIQEAFETVSLCGGDVDVEFQIYDMKMFMSGLRELLVV
jgi:hypothetical protein